MDVLTTLMIIGVAAVAGETAIRVARARAAGAPQLQARLDQLEQRVADQDITLGQVQSEMAGQEAQCRELQDRVNFAERLLTQAQDRTALAPTVGQKPDHASRSR
jgi:uncharacterized coiled-coil protein SlyX